MSYDAFATRADLAAVSSSPPDFAYVAEADASYAYDGGTTEGASFTGVVAGNTLTASSITGTIKPGQRVSGSGVAADTIVLRDLGGGNWLLNLIQDYTSRAMTTAADGSVNLASAAGGRYVLQGRAFMLPPAGGSTDDWPNVIAAAAALAMVGKKLLLGPSTYNYKCQQSIVFDNAWIECTPLTVILCDNASTPPSSLNAPFCVQGQWITNDATANDIAIGGRSIVVVGSLTFAAGDFCALYGATATFRAAHYQVKAWNDGTKTITTDRAIRMPIGGPLATTSFPPGSSLYKAIVVKNARIDFNGCTIKGACWRFLEVILARDCNFNGPVYMGDGTSTTASERGISIDETCFRCYANQLIVNGGDTTPIGMTFESAENCLIEKSHTFDSGTDPIDGASVGFMSTDGVACGFRDCLATGIPASGVEFHGSALSGSYHCFADNVSVIGSLVGLEFNGGSSFCRATGMDLVANTNNLIENNGVDGYYNRVSLSVLRLAGNGIVLDSHSNKMSVAQSIINDNTNGLQISGTASIPQLIGTVLDYNTGITIDTKADLSLIGCSGVSATSGSLLIYQRDNNLRLDLVRSEFTSANVAAPTMEVAGLVNLTASRITAQNNGTAIQVDSGGVVHVGSESTLVAPGASGSALYIHAGGAALVEQGASLTDYSVRCPENTANNVPSLNTLLGISQHTG